MRLFSSRFEGWPFVGRSLQEFWWGGCCESAQAALQVFGVAMEIFSAFFNAAQGSEEQGADFGGGHFPVLSGFEHVAQGGGSGGALFGRDSGLVERVIARGRVGRWMGVGGHCAIFIQRTKLVRIEMRRFYSLFNSQQEVLRKIKGAVPTESGASGRGCAWREGAAAGGGQAMGAANGWPGRRFDGALCRDIDWRACC